MLNMNIYIVRYRRFSANGAQCIRRESNVPLFTPLVRKIDYTIKMASYSGKVKIVSIAKPRKHPYRVSRVRILI